MDRNPLRGLKDQPEVAAALRDCLPLKCHPGREDWLHQKMLSLGYRGIILWWFSILIQRHAYIVFAVKCRLIFLRCKSGGEFYGQSASFFRRKTWDRCRKAYIRYRIFALAIYIYETIETLETKNPFRTIFRPCKNSPAIHCFLPSLSFWHRALGGSRSQVLLTSKWQKREVAFVSHQPEFLPTTMPHAILAMDLAFSFPPVLLIPNCIGPAR